MRFITAITLLSTATSVCGWTLKVNYYKDGGCKDYLVSVNPGWNGCYNYQYNEMNSANIADCDGSFAGCTCRFFTEKNCKGGAWTTATGSFGWDNCASNWGSGFKSMRCDVDNGPDV
ncbi:hypothetical protein BKA66DRAFT_565400 [Pyrenochaeta sp. MPI-SDFR-AT-0127]|nr:hypothetical protein BKA66DRAFT_565400 [Pyrenochaeta sp. MPI-SDFR-AT-0127]